MINLQKVPWVMALEFKEFDRFSSSRTIHFEDARDAFAIKVETGDSLAFTEEILFAFHFQLKEEGTLIVSPEKRNNRNTIRLSLKPQREGAYALFWRMPNFETDLYAVDLIYEEGCYERVVIEFRNPSVNNVDEHAPQNPATHFEETKEKWINEEGGLFFTVL